VAYHILPSLRHSSFVKFIIMKTILIYNSGGGLGDSIQLFPLILSIKKHFKNTKIYYLGAHENHFTGKLKEFNIHLETLDLKLKYFGFRFWHLFFSKKNFKNTRLEKFDLIIDLQSKLRNSLILKQIPHDLFYSAVLDYKLCTVHDNYKNREHLKNLSLFLNTNIAQEDFNLKNISINLIEEAKKLLPNNNYVGFSLTQGNAYRKKSWSINNFIQIAKKLKKDGKTPVFFIDENKKLIKEIKSQIPEALFPEQESSLKSPALVTALSSRLDIAFSIDNGVMHMMSLSKIPMVVLFGPTNSEKFAPKYKSIKILDSKVLYKSDDINLITVNDVLKMF
jgi:ADP-heptose:LPS heptosyltransferase